MRRLALLSLPLATLILAVGLTGGGPSSQATEPSPAPSPSVTILPVEPTPDVTPSPSPVDPSPVPSPAPPAAYSGPLKLGDWIQVTGTDSCLNVRNQPGLTLPYPEADPATLILNCLPDGFIGRLSTDTLWQGHTAVPIFADGHWWWHLFAQGWVAEDWLTFHHEGSPFWPPRSDLASAGYIAYIGKDSHIWVMNADGSEPRLVFARSGDSESFGSLNWSPSGELLLFSAYNSAGGGPQYSVRIVDLSGAVLANLPGLMAAAWAPSGNRLTAIRVTGEGLGPYGTPVVVDLATGQEISLGPPNFRTSVAAAWSPGGQSLAFVCVSWTSSNVAPDGSVIEESIACGGDGLRVVSADGSNPRVILPFDAQRGVSYSNPAWSPNGTTIAVSTNSDATGCRGYSLLDVTTGAMRSCFRFPPAGGLGGGCGIGITAGANAWTNDGRYFLYHGMFGAGQNGVYINDVATEVTTLIPILPVSYISVAPSGQQLAFAGAGNIWVADMDGSDPSPIAEGSSPVWQP